MILPCTHDPRATKQVDPAITLLKSLNTAHPDVLKAHGLNPKDYHEKLVFRSAVESIRGTYIASSLTGRQGLVAEALEVLCKQNLIADFSPMSARERFDFEVKVTTNPKVMAAVEVKGGEGNSINISARPIWADEFILWCHLDGAIVNEPAHGAGAIIFNRVSSELVKRGKQVDAVIFRDARCHTPLRLCPKYKDKQPSKALGVAPDIFLMPRAIPTEEAPKPKTHDLKTTYLPARILAAYGVPPGEFDNHVWQVSIELGRDPNGRLARVTKVFHKGKLIEERHSLR